MLHLAFAPATTRELIKLGRPFMTIEGDFYLPQLSFP